MEGSSRRRRLSGNFGYSSNTNVKPYDGFYDIERIVSDGRIPGQIDHLKKYYNKIKLPDGSLRWNLKKTWVVDTYDNTSAYQRKLRSQPGILSTIKLAYYNASNYLMSFVVNVYVYINRFWNGDGVAETLKYINELKPDVDEIEGYRKLSLGELRARTKEWFKKNSSEAPLFNFHIFCWDKEEHVTRTRSFSEGFNSSRMNEMIRKNKIEELNEKPIENNLNETTEIEESFDSEVEWGKFKKWAAKTEGGPIVHPADVHTTRCSFYCWDGEENTRERSFSMDHDNSRRPKIKAPRKRSFSEGCNSIRINKNERSLERALQREYAKALEDYSEE